MRTRRALLISLLLHGVLLGAVYLIARRQKPPKPAPRVVTLLPVTLSPPAPVAPEPAEPASAAPPPPSPRTTPKPLPAVPSKIAATPPPPGGPRASAPGAAIAPRAANIPITPPALDLYAGALVVGGQEVESGRPSAAELAALAEGRLRGWAEDEKAKGQAQGAPPFVSALGERMATWFATDPASLARHSKLGLGIGALSVVNNYLAMATGPGSAVLAAREQQRPGQMLDKYTEDIGKFHDPGDLDSVVRHLLNNFMACFGACEGFRHDVATLSTVVEVEHDEQGIPIQWHVDVSSGDPPFDDAAVDAVRTTASLAASGAEPPVVARTLWRFEAQALRYGRVELLYDPGFKPPGKEVPSMSGFLGTTTIVQDVKLLSIRYHAEPTVRPQR